MFLAVHVMTLVNDFQAALMKKMRFGVHHNNILLLLLLLPLCILHLGFEAEALSYDYSASIECLKDPDYPQYDGGIIRNPRFDAGVEGWSKFGNAQMELRQSGANNFIVARSRNQPYDSISQKINVQKDMLYTFSAWVQVSDGKAPVTAVLKTSTGYQHGGTTIAESKCWSMLKGGFMVDASGPADLYFETNNTAVEIWVDSVSLQPFSQEEWKSHQDLSIQNKHKRTVRIQAVDAQGNPLRNAKISIAQKGSSVKGLGCASNSNILQNSKYQQWFTSRFSLTTFENEMKWYSTERTPGKEDYSLPDAMLRFMKTNNIAVRGHNIFWDDPKYQPSWLNSKSSNNPFNFQFVCGRRIESIVSRYRGQLIAWDVVNENLHFSFFENNMGANASAAFYDLANRLDPSTLMFMNDFNTIEEPGDQASSPAKYLEKLRQVRSYPGNAAQMAIGLEGHFRVPNLPYMRSAIDTLAAAGLPIWLTEVDVENGPNQAQYLEQILREGHSHPRINGMVIWGAWSPNGCYRMCLTDNNFNNLPTGDVVDKLLREWGIRTLEGTTDSDGFFEASLFHGKYQVRVNHPAVTKSSLTPHSHNFEVPSTNSTTLHLKVSP